MSTPEDFKEIRKEAFTHEAYESAIKYCQKFGSEDDKEYINCIRAYGINFRKAYDQYETLRSRAKARLGA